jgi:hypothetical protein
MRRLAVLAAVLAAASLSACGGEGEGGEGPTMKPGSNCNECHSFGAAGTVFGAGNAASADGVQGVTVTLSGGGQTVTRTTNSAGNFYTSTALPATVDVTLQLGGVTVSKPGHHSGGCGACHSSAGAAGIRIHLGPNRTTTAACSACH